MTDTAHFAPQASNTTASISSFPKDFLWGASSSAFQVEGGRDEGGKGRSVADFNASKRADRQADTSVASDFFHHWREDIELMATLGLKAYRFSIAWSRVIPDGDGTVNEEGVAFYDQVIDCLLAHGIQPLVTLYHFDLPCALVEKYNGWADRRCALAYERFARVCFERFGDRVRFWQTINEQNLMVRVDERMNIYVDDELEADRLRAQMDYHMFLGSALATAACHELVRGGKVGPAISSCCTYPLTNKPEDVWAARMNDYLKAVYSLDMYYWGEYGGLYRRYLDERGITPVTFRGDEDILAQGRFDYLAVNYYRTLCASALPADAEHPAGSRAFRGNEVDFDQYGWCRDERNENLPASEYGAQIDPTGLRIVLNDYWSRYHAPMIITENGLGTPDELTADGRVHDPYRIDYLRAHIQACADAIDDGVELFGYSPWSFTDLLSSHQGFRKRYGFVYIDRDEFDTRELRRIPKDSYRWYQQVIASNGAKLAQGTVIAALRHHRAKCHRAGWPCQPAHQKGPYMGLLSKLFKSEPADGGDKTAMTQATPSPVTVTGGTDTLAAPADGTVIPLDKVPDPVFAGGMLGQGCGIEPTGGTVYAPISGTLTALAPTMHGVGIAGDSGLEVLVHVGVDTVEMGGDGFAAHVAQGEHVEAGQPLVSFDRAKIAAAGHPDTVIVVVSNTAELAGVEVCASGTISAGQPLIKVAR